MTSIAATQIEQDAADIGAFTPTQMLQVLEKIRSPVSVVRDRTSQRLGLIPGDGGTPVSARLEYVCHLPALAPEHLGDASFLRAHGVCYPYIAGEMATGIATVDMVKAMANAGMLGFFGAGGLPLAAIERAVQHLGRDLAGTGRPWGVNLIHNLQDPAAEEAVVDLLLEHSVRRVCASAYLQLTPAVVRYACRGLRLGDDGRVVRLHQLMAKVSRPEVAVRFGSPAPAEMLQTLVGRGQLTADEATLAARLPLATDITVEADSGGHTDNRPLVAIFPTIARAVREAQARHGYEDVVRIGAAGGLGTPQSLTAAFSLGAAYVVTGSINQASLESGQSSAARALLAQAATEDVVMAPAADMFELGAKVQVLKRGTLFGVRAQKLYELYRRYPSIEAIPESERQQLEVGLFRAPLEDIWRQTQDFFAGRNTAELERAKREPRHRMALVFRWYLGQASRWAMQGIPDRVLDYQIWCGPAMGAFNAWTQGSFLSDPKERGVVQIARNLLEGAALVTRAQQLRCLGVSVPAAAFDVRPRRFT